MQLENRRELELKAGRELDHEVDKDGLREKEKETFELAADGEGHTDEDGEDEETWADEQITEEIYADEDKMEKMVRHLAETNLELHRLTESVLKMEAKMGLVENGEDEKEAEKEEEGGGCNCKREQVESGTRVEEGKDTIETENGGKHEGEKEDKEKEEEECNAKDEIHEKEGNFEEEIEIGQDNSHNIKIQINQYLGSKVKV